MGSKDKRTKQKYGILGYCEKNGESHVILNTINNIIRCSSCPYFRALKTSKMEPRKDKTISDTVHHQRTNRGMVIGRTRILRIRSS